MADDAPAIVTTFEDIVVKGIADGDENKNLLNPYAVASHKEFQNRNASRSFLIVSSFFYLFIVIHVLICI